MLSCLVVLSTGALRRGSYFQFVHMRVQPVMTCAEWMFMINVLAQKRTKMFKAHFFSPKQKCTDKNFEVLIGDVGVLRIR